ncbi:RNA polymerase sigma factor [Streptomyces sp. NPDC050658]|uniref:RNA polymerase sigma factor n=1 Tax=unclassified Streptomyces TaxID=2593676 RepID=UPI003426E46B
MPRSFLSRPTRYASSDATALAAVQRGQIDAFRLIHERHYPAVHAYAMECLADAEAVGGLSTRVFRRVLMTRLRGGTVIGVRHPGCLRRELLDGVRSGAVAHATYDRAALAPGFRDWVAKGAAWPMEDGSQLAQAFERLPRSAQILLWHGVVERDDPQLIARITGQSEAAVAASTQRARELLRGVRLGLHAERAGRQECREALAGLEAPLDGAVVSGIAAHGLDCPWCREAGEDLADLDGRLGSHLPAWQLGWWPGPRYLRLKAASSALADASAYLSEFPEPGATWVPQRARARSARHRFNRKPHDTGGHA